MLINFTLSNHKFNRIKEPLALFSYVVFFVPSKRQENHIHYYENA